MNQLPGDPNLPPGCTNADIDRRFGGAPVQICVTCGKPFEPEDDDEECPECRKEEET